MPHVPCVRQPESAALHLCDMHRSACTNLQGDSGRIHRTHQASPALNKCSSVWGATHGCHNKSAVPRATRLQREHDCTDLSCSGRQLFQPQHSKTRQSLEEMCFPESAVTMERMQHVPFVWLRQHIFSRKMQPV